MAETVPSRYSYGRRLPGLQFNASLAMTSPLNLPAPGRCQALYFMLSISQSHVFLVNSRLGRFSAPSREGPFLPKLQGNFA